MLDALIAEDTLDQPGEAVRIDIEKSLGVGDLDDDGGLPVRSESPGS